MPYIFLTISIFLLVIASAYIFYIFYRSNHIHYFHYKSNKTITYIVLLLSIVQLLSALIEKFTDGIEVTTSSLDNIAASVITGITASGFLFMLTYIQTQKEEKNNLELLLKKVAEFNIITKKIKYLLNKTSQNREIKYNISLFKNEIATAYQIASACKPSFIPIIAVADSFIQRLEATNPASITESTFKDIDLLHSFLYSNNQHITKIHYDIPKYKDIKDINETYKNIYEDIYKTEIYRKTNDFQKFPSLDRTYAVIHPKSCYPTGATSGRQVKPLKVIRGGGKRRRKVDSPPASDIL